MSSVKKLERFNASLSNEVPPSEWSSGLKSLWYDVKENWKASHDLAQEMVSQDGSWIHAYLHRKEGDRFNAEYWYKKANRAYPSISLEEEQKELVAYFIEKQSLNTTFRG